MRGRRYLHIYLFLLLTITLQPAWAQLGFDLDIKKPEPYENRELKAEKTGDKKLKFTRRLMQNTTTHYNYFFNANNKLKSVIERAKSTHKDDYSKLLSFYNYSLDNTSKDKEELDSIIYKSKTGIVLHDLRNDWIDDLYLLWGAAYYMQKQYDSAYQMFQFINYAFAEKEKDGYYRYIGSRMDGNVATSIASKEKHSFPKSLISDPPSRNDALIWQIRTLMQSNAMVEAGSLIIALKNDPAFPKRLTSSLEEVQAYWYYKQNKWDSAANHLVNALGNAGTNSEKARWEYLAAQLFEKAGILDQAATFYNKSIVHTTDPVMDIYARLNLIRIHKTGDENPIDKNIAELLKMAKRDKYENYRDVIYYMAAQMELERNNYAAAQQYFIKAAKYKNDNLSSSNQGFLQLADLFFTQKNYIQAAAFYDSVRIENLLTEDAQRITQRKELLSRLVNQVFTVQRHDSMQRIAALPENEREDYIRKLVRQLRRQQGLKEEGVSTGTGVGEIKGTTDFFTNKNKGEWYFYNNSIRTSGAAAFKQIWGNRPNVDNWRRSSNAVAQLRNNQPNNTRGNPTSGIVDINTSLTYDALLDKLPLTEQQLQSSNDSISNALYTLGRIYTDEVEDYEAAIKTYEDLLLRFPTYNKKDEVLFHLYYNYTKTGNTAKATEIKKLLNTQYPNSRYTTIVATGTNPVSNKSTEITKTYENVYDLFIEGKFVEAKEAKRIADSLYKTNYWSPQLLYIEAVYHIKQGEDSIAKNTLNTLIRQNSGSPIGDKASTLVNVLNRRQQIEQELANLQIERPQEEKPAEEPEPEPEPVLVTKTQQVKTDTAIAKPIAVNINKPIAKQIIDTTTNKSIPIAAKTFTYKPEVTHYAAIILNKIDVVFGNEAKNAFNRYHREKYYNRTLQIDLVPIDDENKLLLIGEFSNIQGAVDYVQKAKPLAATEIMPWLKGDKYSFTIISDTNLQVLKENRDLNLYKKFMDQNLPIKF